MRTPTDHRLPGVGTTGVSAAAPPFTVLQKSSRLHCCQLSSRRVFSCEDDVFDISSH